MADTTFYQVRPALKAIDNGDGAYRCAIVCAAEIGTASVFENTPVAANPNSTAKLKAINLGDGTYAMSGVLQ